MNIGGEIRGKNGLIPGRILRGNAGGGAPPSGRVPRNRAARRIRTEMKPETAWPDGLDFRTMHQQAIRPGFPVFWRGRTPASRNDESSFWAAGNALFFEGNRTAAGKGQGAGGNWL